MDGLLKKKIIQSAFIAFTINPTVKEEKKSIQRKQSISLQVEEENSDQQSIAGTTHTLLV